ncbi:S8 family serine peptidase [Amycolatopsis sp. YIM 10]|uniref:S8 family serine peptidase n=1 Tax=Amycolatopsis sp. YIM 10 TaxID=2653857 RepID=UPI00128FE86D|nr:S8 family serine peptidase [Amycolatopsis sp. YIM 10]QFU93084.1 Extracellular serine proteinase precursor [Amycolatopsis sp. YIM 10]
MRALLGILGSAALLAVLPGTSAASSPEGAVVQASEPVSGGYVVSLEDTVSTSTVDSIATSLTSRYGGDLKSTFSVSMRGFALRGLSEAQARRLAADPAVKAVYQDGTARVAGTQPNATYGVDRIDQRNLPLDKNYTYNNTAADVTAYVLDSGIRYSHTEFEGRAKSGYDFVDTDPDANDCHGHGTHVSGTIGGKTWGVAKQVKLVGVKVLGCGGSAPDSDSLEGIEWVAKNAAKPAVANMSMTFDTAGIGDDAMRGMLQAGVATVVAAGNDNGGNACDRGPAKIPEVLTVASTDASDNRSSFSNIGTCVDLFAPGSNITSASHLNDTAGTGMSGTSMASPHGAGAAAMYLQANKSATPEQVNSALTSNATEGVVKNAGSGSPNRLLYTGFIGGGQQPANDFSLSVSPGSVTVEEPGGSGSVDVGTQLVKGTAESVALSATGLPSGATATFAPTSVTAGEGAELTIATGTSTPDGTYRITVTGKAASVTRTAGVTLVVGAPAGDISVSASPSSGTGGFGTQVSTTIKASGGSGNLTFSAGTPPGVFAFFNPATIASGGSSTLTFFVLNAPAGTYPITVTATSADGATGSTVYTLTTR